MVSGGITGNIIHREGDGLAAPLVPQPIHAVRIMVIYDMDNRTLPCRLPGVGQG